MAFSRQARRVNTQPWNQSDIPPQPRCVGELLVIVDVGRCACYNFLYCHFSSITFADDFATSATTIPKSEETLLQIESASRYYCKRRRHGWYVSEAMNNEEGLQSFTPEQQLTCSRL